MSSAVFVSTTRDFQTIWHEYLMCVFTAWCWMILTFMIWFYTWERKEERCDLPTNLYRDTNIHKHPLTQSFIRMKWMCFHVSAFSIFFSSHVCVRVCVIRRLHIICICACRINFFLLLSFFIFHFLFYFLRNFMQIKVLFRRIIAIDKQRQIPIYTECFVNTQTIL